MINWLMKLFGMTGPKIPGYLGRDLSQHRVYTTRYEDLCK